MISNNSGKAGHAPAPRRPAFGLSGRVIAGFSLAVLLVFGVGGWAATAKLAGAVIAQGAVVVDENVKAIQHRDGGIVQDIAVREGDLVQEGQILIQLDDADTRAELSIVRLQMMELTARRSRLLAERDGLDEIEFPGSLDRSDPEVSGVVSGEERLFQGNRVNRESEKQQIELAMEQIGDEIDGLEAQRAAKEDEIRLVRVELGSLSKLAEQGLVQLTRVYSVDRERARLLGEIGEIDAGIARANTRISELRLQIIDIDESSRTEAQRELSEVETRLSEFRERELAIVDRLTRTSIRAPISGVVNELNIHTIGGVVTPAEVLVTIVPEGAKLKVEVKLAPVTIDQVSVGQVARMRFTSFNHRTTPEILGRVSHVSAATTRDAASGEEFFLGEVELTPEELAKLPSPRLLPGTPVEVFVQTDSRTALSYLAKPVTDQFNRALRER